MVSAVHCNMFQCMCFGATLLSFQHLKHGPLWFRSWLEVQVCFCLFVFFCFDVDSGLIQYVWMDIKMLCCFVSLKISCCQVWWCLQVVCRMWNRATAVRLQWWAVGMLWKRDLGRVFHEWKGETLSIWSLVVLLSQLALLQCPLQRCTARVWKGKECVFSTHTWITSGE